MDLHIADPSETAGPYRRSLASPRCSGRERPQGPSPSAIDRRMRRFDEDLKKKGDVACQGQLLIGQGSKPDI